MGRVICISESVRAYMCVWVWCGSSCHSKVTHEAYPRLHTLVSHPRHICSLLTCISTIKLSAFFILFSWKVTRQMALIEGGAVNRCMLGNVTQGYSGWLTAPGVCSVSGWPWEIPEERWSSARWRKIRGGRKEDYHSSKGLDISCLEIFGSQAVTLRLLTLRIHSHQTPNTLACLCHICTTVRSCTLETLWVVCMICTQISKSLICDLETNLCYGYST